MSDNYVQFAEAVGSTTAVATMTGVTAGNTIIAFASNGGPGSTFVGVSDSQGAYTARGSVISDTGNKVYLQIYQLDAANSGTHIVTFTAGSGDNAYIALVEVGTSSISPFSGTNGAFQSAPGTGTDALSSGSVPVSGNSTLVAFSCDSGSLSSSDEPTTGTGFTSRANSTNVVLGAWRIETKAVSGATAATYTANTGSHTFITLAVSILNSGGGAAVNGTVSQRRPSLNLGTPISRLRGPTVNSTDNNVTLALTGQAATFTAGTVAASQAASDGQAIPGREPGLRLGTPLSRLRGPVFDSTDTNVSISLTGQAATFTAGTLTPNAQASDGATALARSALSLGTPFSRLRSSVFGGQSNSPDVTVSLTGQSATFSAGSLTPSTSVALTGQAATFTAGALVSNTTLGITGQSATFSAGTLTANLAVSLTGQAATFTAGQLTPSTTIALAGQSATFTAGNITANAGGDLTIALTGQAATFSTGTLTPQTALALVGTSATFSSGALTSGTSVALNGIQAQFATGSLTATGGDVTIALTGQSASFTAGQIAASGGTAVQIDQGAGRRRRTIYFITIDGVRFECGSVQEALQLLKQAKEQAAKLAEDQAMWAIAAQEASPEPIPVPKLHAPKIEVSSRDLRSAANATKREIKAIYDKELEVAEMRMLLELSKRRQDDDDAINLFLM